LKHITLELQQDARLTYRDLHRNCSYLKNIVYLLNKIVIAQPNKIVFARVNKKVIMRLKRKVNIQTI